MSIQHALLTSLLEKPSTGYQLARRFDRSIGHFWQATHQQIYRELRRMATSGWVEVEEKGEEGGRQSKMYHVLPAGQQELERWVSVPGSSGESNEALMVKLRAEAVLGPLGVRDELLRLIEGNTAAVMTESRQQALQEASFPPPDALAASP